MLNNGEDTKMKKQIKILMTLSIMFNIVTVILIIWLQFGGFFKLFIYPSYERHLDHFASLEINSSDTVFLGDSLTFEGKWHELFPKSNIRNRGLIGDITSGILGRLDQITKKQPAQVFLMAGINDLSMGIPEKEIVTNIVKIVDTINNSSPNTEIFVQSLLPNKHIFGNKIESINSKLELNLRNKATWINLYPLFLDNEGKEIDSSFSNDSAHLLGEGYIVWRDAIDSFVNKAE